MQLLHKNITNLSLLGLLCLMLMTACSKDDPVDKDNSIFVPTNPASITNFDRWLQKNVTYPYNIEVLYKYDDINTNHTYYLTPAELNNVHKIVQIVKYSWLEAYDETAGLDFTRKFAPKQISLIGSSAYNSDGTETLATAEGGLKVTMYRVNKMEMRRDYFNFYYFHTMHHEFCHILHQTKNYSTDFQKISQSDYIAGDWYLVTEKEAAKKGFVSPYSMYEENEDFAEVYSIFLTSSDTEWKKILDLAGPEGAAIINRKLDLVREYTLSAWDFDLDKLRLNVNRRTEKAMNMDFETFN